MLSLYQGKFKQLTLVRGPTFNQGFLKLGVKSVEFPSLFRSTAFSTNTASLMGLSMSSAGARRKSQTSEISKIVTSPVEKQGDLEWRKPPCPFFAKGHCKYGNTCKQTHIKTVKSPTDLMSCSGADVDVDDDAFSVVSKHKPDERDVIDLPEKSELLYDLVPVNKLGSRIDTALPRPTNDEWDAFLSRVGRQKLCNKHYLAQRCHGHCMFDHSEADASVINSLRHIARTVPCPRRGRCRDPDCFHGHMCSRRHCRGGYTCKFTTNLHRVDMYVASWESEVNNADPPDVQAEDNNVNVDAEEANGDVTITPTIQTPTEDSPPMESNDESPPQKSRSVSPSASSEKIIYLW